MWKLCDFVADSGPHAQLHLHPSSISISRRCSSRRRRSSPSALFAASHDSHQDWMCRTKKIFRSIVKLDPLESR
ncbi:hypothetical protein LWI29_027875 [Acer saccharum]|uniref:Uncharacterized protein n=1 Tax=Acer saccharum TaxID=4024 RepID=A0AA39ST99_ACESA|nr:hypothetical protein LWI29_027875 [Acer saccharum]